MSVGKRLKLAQARLHLAEAEVALMRTEHRLKMAAENAEIAEIKCRLADAIYDKELLDSGRIEIRGCVYAGQDLRAAIAAAAQKQNQDATLQT